jgi:pimeloyl-ACP methyl ester carboxylesterase
MPLILFPSHITGKWLIRGLSIHGYQPHELEAEQLIVSAMSLRSRIPFRPSIGDDELRNLRMPTLLLIGEREILYDARSAVERARQLIPGIETAIIANAGHMLTTDQPKEVFRHVLRFLQQPLGAEPAQQSSNTERMIG